MSDHTTVFVPLESWSYNSPELRANNKLIDVGLLAESLIYYDRVILNVANQPQFATLIEWFQKQGKYQDFLSLINDGVIKVFEYSFATAAVDNLGVYTILNIQDEIQAQPNTFEKRYLYHKAVQDCLPHARHRNALYKALRENVIEAKADEYGSPIENAREDYNYPERNALIIQAFVDEVYKYRNLGNPPIVSATVSTSPDNRRNITWSINFNDLSNLAGKDLNFHNGTPLTAGAICNRLLLSAARLNCDLYLGQPMGILVGDKLYESSLSIDKSHSVIEELKEKVEYPDVRSLINDNHLGLDEILKIRKKAKKFRQWLQTESDRDRDAIIAYHHEVAKESGIIKTTRKVLNLFGVIGGGALGATLGNTVSGLEGAALGGGAGSAAGYLMDLASKLGADWKPVVFGNWVKDRIDNVLAEKNKN